MEAMDKIAINLEDTAKRRNGKILYWYVNKLRGTGQPVLVPVKCRNGSTISNKERGKE